jgi:hypothetical protein
VGESLYVKVLKIWKSADEGHNEIIWMGSSNQKSFKAFVVTASHGAFPTGISLYMKACSSLAPV